MRSWTRDKSSQWRWRCDGLRYPAYLLQNKGVQSTPYVNRDAFRGYYFLVSIKPFLPRFVFVVVVGSFSFFIN